jgi:hypothetical protein
MPVSAKSLTGGDSPTGAVKSRNVQRDSGFFASVCPSMGGSGREPQGSPVLHRSVNLPESHPPRLTGGFMERAS